VTTPCGILPSHDRELERVENEITETVSVILRNGFAATVAAILKWVGMRTWKIKNNMS
jgi:hypothetical protein